MKIMANAVAAVTRYYPLLSGAARIANSRIFRSLGRSHVEDAWVPVGKEKMLVPVNDFVGRSVFFFGDLDPKITGLAKHCIEPGDVALDIGSNLGTVAMKMVKFVGPSGMVHAFEPSPRMVSYISQTLQANPALPIKLHPYALGAESATLQLHVPLENAGEASFLFQHVSSKPIDVPVRTLTDVIAEEGITRIDFIKIDVEGFESEVIRGAQGALRDLKPKFILFEEHSPRDTGQLPECMTVLIDMGYKLFGINKTYLNLSLEEFRAGCNLTTWDYLAVSEAGLPKIASLVAHRKVD